MATIIVSKNNTGTYANTGYTGFVDTKLRGLNPTTNYSNETTFATTSWDKSAGDVETTVLKADISSVSAGTVSSAEIGFYLDNGNNVDSSGVSLFALLVDFSETQATFNIRKTSTNWNTGGARGSGTDRQSAAFITVPRPATSGAWIQFSGTAVDDMVQDWLDGTLTNNGFVAELQNHDIDPFFTFQSYISSEGTDGNRPYLKFDHTSSGVTVALTGIGNTYSAGSLSGSVTKGLTGSAQTASQGTLVKVHSKALTNNAINASQGALASAIAFALTGQPFTYTQGTVTPDATSNINVALTGQQYAFTQANVTASHSKALTGQQATETAGNLSKSISKAITGQGNTYASGLFTSVIAKALSGASSSYTQGIVSPTGTINIQLTGSTFTYSAGTLTASSSKEISGQFATLSQGTLATLIARALSGQSHTALQGTLTPENGVAIQLTGQQASYAQGYLTASLSKQLIGSSSTYRQGTLSVFGQSIPQYPLDGAVITYPLAGSNINYPLGT